jgi:hypothetical protein
MMYDKRMNDCVNKQKKASEKRTSPLSFASYRSPLSRWLRQALLEHRIGLLYS